MTSWNRMIQERIIDSDLIDGFAVLTAYHTQCIYSYGELEVLSKVDPQKFQSLGRIFDKIDITDSVIKIPNIQSQYQVFYKSMSSLHGISSLNHYLTITSFSLGIFLATYHSQQAIKHIEELTDLLRR